MSSSFIFNDLVVVVVVVVGASSSKAALLFVTMPPLSRKKEGIVALFCYRLADLAGTSSAGQHLNTFDVVGDFNETIPINISRH